MVNKTENEIQNGKKAEIKRKKEAREKIKKNLKKNRRMLSVTFVAGARIGAITAVGVIEPLFKKIGRNCKIISADRTLRRNAEIVLLEQGLAIKDEDGDIIIKDNDINDYRCLDLTNASLLEQHIYSEVLRSEFDDAIQTANYGGYYYTGTAQYRTINGYFDINTRESSFAEQKAAMEDELLEAYENNCEGIIRTSEELQESRAMGGRK